MGGSKCYQAYLETEVTVIGLGSGSTIAYTIEYLATTSLAKSTIYIPTSFQTRERILSHKLCLGSIKSKFIIDKLYQQALYCDLDIIALILRSTVPIRLILT